MKTNYILSVLIATLLLGLVLQPAFADRIDNVVQGMNNSISAISRETHTLRQLLNQEHARRIEMRDELLKQIWRQEKLSIDNFSEIRQQLRDIENRLREQDRIIKKLASQ